MHQNINDEIRLNGGSQNMYILQRGEKKSLQNIINYVKHNIKCWFC